MDYHHGGVNSAISRGQTRKGGTDFLIGTPLAWKSVSDRAQRQSFHLERAFFGIRESGGGHWCVSPLHGECSNGVGWVRFDCALDIPNNAIALAKVRRSRIACRRARCASGMSRRLLYQIRYYTKGKTILVCGHVLGDAWIGGTPCGELELELNPSNRITSG